jgi:hypothetical protein
VSRIAGVRERGAGLRRLETYADFADRVRATKRKLFLDRGEDQPQIPLAPSCYCGIRSDFLDYTVDRNLYKHGKYLPGAHIPIFPPERIFETKPDYVLTPTWNLKGEIMSQLTHIRNWGAKLVVPIPQVSVI